MKAIMTANNTSPLNLKIQNTELKIQHSVQTGSFRHKIEPLLCIHTLPKQFTSRLVLVCGENNFMFGGFSVARKFLCEVRFLKI